MEAILLRCVMIALAAADYMVIDLFDLHQLQRYGQAQAHDTLRINCSRVSETVLTTTLWRQRAYHRCMLYVFDSLVGLVKTPGDSTKAAVRKASFPPVTVTASLGVPHCA